MAASAGIPDKTSADTKKGGRRSRRETTRIVGAAVGLVLLVAFVLDNSQNVTVGFVFFNARLSLIWVLIIAAVLGAVTDRLVILLRARRRAKAATLPTT